MISINYRSGLPIYEQVRDGFRQLIITGVLPADSKMPSVREMASSLAINPNTIQRAYRELETEGYFYKVPGRGTFVCKMDPKESPRRKELMDLFDQTVSELLFLDISTEELEWRLQELERQHNRSVEEGGTKS